MKPYTLAEKVIKLISKIRPFKSQEVLRIVEKMPCEEKYRRIRKALISTILAFSYEILDKYGRSGEGILKEIFTKNNEEYMKLSLDLFNIKERDARTACSIITASDALIGVESEIIEFSPNRCVRKIKKCPIYSESRKIGKKDDEILRLCKVIMQSLCTSSAKAINPNLDYEYKKWLAKGDGYCEEVITMKKP